MCLFIRFIEYTDREMLLYSAHTNYQFNNLLNELHCLQEDLGSKAADALLMYLMRLRTGRTLIEIATHFGVSKTTVQRRIELVRERLNIAIVPRYLNFERDREDLVSHKSNLSSILFDGNDTSRAHLILDGTYIYIEKSFNHIVQKQTYNSHKKRNYLKMMMCVGTDGSIIHISGPYKATENDATITNKIINDSTSVVMKNYQPGDIMIVDRGFRDCVIGFQNHGFIVKMPTCSHNPQLTAFEANSTRCVTIVRHHVERVNGLLKSKWRLFSTVIDAHAVLHIATDFKIGAALINRISQPAINNIKHTEFARQMMNKLNQPNLLSSAVSNKNFQRIIKSKSYDSFTDFTVIPNLTLDDLELISFGPYQILQGQLYLSNQLYQNEKKLDVYRFFHDDVTRYCKDLFTSDSQPMLLMICLKSRFESAKSHRVFVMIDVSKAGIQSVLHYYCSCKVGNRTAGCCSHVMALLFYICHAPSNGGVREISKHLNNLFNEEMIEDEVIDEDEEMVEIEERDEDQSTNE